MKKTTTWKEALMSCGGSPEDEIQEGFQTSEFIAAEMGVGRSTARERLRKGVEEGRVEMKKFFKKAAGGMVMPVPHYRIK